MNNLALSKTQYTLIFNNAAQLPTFIGNTIRGALGQSLYDNNRSVYDAVFKTSPETSIPNPFAISAPYPCKNTYNRGDTLAFFITLFGFACEYDDVVSDAVRLMCKGKLLSAELLETDSIYSCDWSDSGAESIERCDKITLDFVSPTELLGCKKPVFEPDFSTFIDSLFGRILDICDNYGKSEFIIPYSMIARKPQVTAEYDLKRVQINSNKNPINGFVGKVIYFGDVTRYLPYIDLGSQIHIGKKTTRSCGEYSFEI